MRKCKKTEMHQNGLGEGFRSHIKLIVSSARSVLQANKGEEVVATSSSSQVRNFVHNMKTRTSAGVTPSINAKPRNNKRER